VWLCGGSGMGVCCVALWWVWDGFCVVVPTATSCNTLQLVAPHCIRAGLGSASWFALQHTATYCNILQHTATHCNTLQHTVTHCNILQHTATYCNTLQHTATHCNTLPHTATGLGWVPRRGSHIYSGEWEWKYGPAAMTLHDADGTKHW